CTYTSTFILNPVDFFNGKSTNLSGGTFKEGMDYNRKEMANIFKDTENGINLCKHLSNKYRSFDNLKDNLNSEIELLKKAA
ncbi:MAG: hypothetical protein KDD45_02425, partial [Bdellovibrionales bacterium]|nr:hypothetical protein [Bdellovibrionales bacterium]